MKNLKTKIGLSVLALACFGAGALTFQTNVSANADEVTVQTTDVISMVNGAQICLEDDFSGIRWLTEVKAGEELAGKNTTFGVVVAPTADFGVNGLTLDTAGAMNLAFAEGDISQDASNVVMYYSVINYNDVSESLKQQAYALELTARAYVIVDGTTYYADLSTVSTSRSARQIAINAELTGQLDKYRDSENEAYNETKAAKAVEYYGATEKITLSNKQKDFVNGNAFVVDKSTYAGSTEFTIDLEGASIQEVVIGAESVEYEYAGTTLNVKDVDFIGDEGEYFITIFTNSATNPIAVKPFIYATKVLTKTDDLMMFRAKGVKGDNSTTRPTGYANWNANQEFPGYYVLGNNIDASKLADGTTAYKHGSVLEDGTTFNASTWQGADKYTKEDGTPYEIGLTGTFNGMGYTISNLTIASEQEGFFGIVNQGTVKNAGFTNVRRGAGVVYVLANYLIDATIEDVYITTNTNFENSKTALLANYSYGSNKISNCVFQYKNHDTNVGKSALFASNRAGTYTFENVFIYAQASATIYTDEALKTVTTEDDPDTEANEEVATWALKTVEFLPLVLTTQAKPRKVDAATGEMSGTITKGTIVVAENQVVDANAETLVPADGLGISTDVYDIQVIKGVYSYSDATAWTTATHDYSSFFVTGCWSQKSNGLPGWKTA